MSQWPRPWFSIQPSQFCPGFANPMVKADLGGQGRRGRRLRLSVSPMPPFSADDSEEVEDEEAKSKADSQKFWFSINNAIRCRVPNAVYSKGR